MKWIVYQWHRMTWAFDHDGGVWVQGFAATVTAVVTVALCLITWRYVRLTNRLAANSDKQLRLLAHPNVFVSTVVNSQHRYVTVSVTNKGVYPFKIRKAHLQGNDEESEPFEIPMKELWNVVVGSNDTARTEVFLHERKIEFQSFSDFVEVEFDCEDVMGLVGKRYYHSKVYGLREANEGQFVFPTPATGFWKFLKK
jgi:hypothetical protein